jgi:hypothetical protein
MFSQFHDVHAACTHHQVQRAHEAPGSVSNAGPGYVWQIMANRAGRLQQQLGLQQCLSASWNRALCCRQTALHLMGLSRSSAEDAELNDARFPEHRRARP